MAKKPAVADMKILKVPLTFYVTDAGNEPVRDWLKTLTKQERRAIGQDLTTAQYAWPAKMPLCRALGEGLFEIRTSLPNKIARVFIGFVEGQLVALNAIIKKTPKTPDQDLELARKRLKDLTG